MNADIKEEQDKKAKMTEEEEAKLRGISVSYLRKIKRNTQKQKEEIKLNEELYNQMSFLVK